MIKQYAIDHAKAFYGEQGWSIVNVSATYSYDLLCILATGKKLHVEAKSMIWDGEQNLLIANKVVCAHILSLSD